ncbi:hypothetical protein TorRG33x02_252580 [Trema orientale]|uniref:Uncharacterized protein n=1 Tax=Trema orientale TaxID=63057 RepID=A0A2P5DFR6_TREOI|nr:hypothetical protein TorRG33x02_252580 [Trema orientale]
MLNGEQECAAPLSVHSAQWGSDQTFLGGRVNHIPYWTVFFTSLEFRFLCLNSKLLATGACEPPFHYHKYRFSLLPIYTCDQSGLYSAYTGEFGKTRAVVNVIDTDSKGQVQSQQQVKNCNAKNISQNSTLLGGKCTSWVGYVAAELGIVIVIPLVVCYAI